MSPWNQGAARVEELLDTGRLVRLRGADAGRQGLMRRAREQLASAELLVSTDPVTAYVVAYDAAKHAGMALLAEQDLRVTPEGGHAAIQQVLTTQFGGVFESFGRLRRRRGDLDYPSSDEDFADADETRRAIGQATQIVEGAEAILDQGILTVF